MFTTCVMVTDALAVQPCASVMVQVYVPRQRFVAVGFVPPAGDQKYAYGEVPPETFTDAEPVHSPQLDEVALTFAKSGCGCVMLMMDCEVQPFASVTVNVYAPAHRPATLCVVSAPGIHR